MSKSTKSRTTKKGGSNPSVSSLPVLFDEDELLDVDESSETTAYRYKIVSYGVDYPVDALVKRIESGAIVVPSFDPKPEPTPKDLVGFQRRSVWTKKQSDRFIESLLLGLPVPEIFLVKQDDGTLLVLDGQQRLNSLRDFYSGLRSGRSHALEGVQSEFVGKTYANLEAEDRRRLDDSLIHATVVRQEEPSADQSSIYLMFERLNTGGTFLQPQEIRVALYRGPLIELLRELNENPDWREIFGPPSKRFKDQELILRFFALYFSSDGYFEPMKEFLNEFAGKWKSIGDKDRFDFAGVFQAATESARKHLGKSAFRLTRAVNAAVLESVLVGLARRLRKGPITDGTAVKAKFDDLLVDKNYRSAVERSTADRKSVETRLRLATDAFGGVA